MSEETNAQTFVDRQIDFNKEIVSTSAKLYDGLKKQAKVNQALAEELHTLEDTLKTHRQLITGLLIGYFASTIGLVIWMMS